MTDLIVFVLGLLGLALLVLIVTIASDWTSRGWQRTQLPDPDPDWDEGCMGWWLPDPDPAEPVVALVGRVDGQYLLTLEEIGEDEPARRITPYTVGRHAAQGAACR